MDINFGAAFVSIILLVSVITSKGANQPNVTVSPKETVLNEGDNFTVYCNFPGIETLDMVNSFPPEWFKGSKRLSYLSSVDNDLKDTRFKVEVKAEGNQRNLTAILDIVGVKASDEGQYKCTVTDREDTTMLKIRRPIQTMTFLLHQGSKHKVTQDDSEKTITIDSGKYAPVCEASGSFPEPTFVVKLGDDVLRGRVITLQGNNEAQFIANEMELSHNDDGNKLTCTASVPDLVPVQSISRSMVLKVNKLDPEFSCINSSATEGDRRHILTCNVANVKNIDCKAIIWERMDTKEQFSIEDKESKIIVKCSKNTTTNSAETTLEIPQVLKDHFKAEWAIMYRFGHNLVSKRYFTTIQELSAASSLSGVVSIILSVAAAVLLL